MSLNNMENLHEYATINYFIINEIIRDRVEKINIAGFLPFDIK